MGDKSEDTFSLPTKSLVLEGVYFHDPDFLPQLFKEMPNFHHIELQYNGTPSALQALSRHCRNLESLCFQEPRRRVSLLEKDILPILFGIPPIPSLGFPINLLGKFVEEKEFREKFMPQFPNLKKLDLDELYFEEYTLHDVYTLALVLYPKLSGFGKHTGLTNSMLLKYRELWSIVNDGSECQINLTKAKFVDSVYVVPSRDPELELKYLEAVVPMFKTLKSVEVLKTNWNETEVAKFCRMFANQVDALSLNVLPVNEISCLGNFTHLRLTYMQPSSSDQVHLILDNCLNLKTLSFHPVFQEHPLADRERDELLQHFGDMIDEDLHILEHLFGDELIQEIPHLRVLQEENIEDLGAIGGVPVPPRPPPRYDRISKPKFKIHHKLTTLRIACLMDAARESVEIFLESLLERLPNLRNLCLGMWMGSLCQRRQNLTCTGNALVSVVTRKKNTKPLLTQLEQLCCLPHGTGLEMCLLSARLTESLPCLHTLVVPALDTFLLTPTLRYFQHTSIEIQHKCATEQVFTSWEPEH